jgi:hypothetical protein
VSVAQLQQSDRLAWKIIAEATRAGIQRRPDGTYPVNESLKDVLTDADFLFSLVNMPSGHTSKASSSASASGDPDDANKKQSRGQKRRTNQKSKQASAQPQKKPKQQPANNSQKKGAGKGPGKGPGVNSAGMAFANAAGVSLCFAYNSQSGCSSGVPTGQSCAKGLHACAKPGCTQTHPMAGNH